MRRRTIPLALAALLGCAAAPLAAQRAVEVQLAPPFLRMQIGAQTAILATAYSREGTPIDVRLWWSSTNINVATVDSNGMVRAVAPGVAIVTAAPDSGSRRRPGRVTVLVVGSTPQPPVAPGAPGAHAPSLPSAPGGAEPRPAMIDTARAESCDDPQYGMRNPGRACFDRRASPRAPPSLDAPAACQRPVSPAALLVRVEANGEVSDVRPYRASSCLAYQELAMAWIRDVAFSPARRGERPVASWLAVVVVPREGMMGPMPMAVPRPSVTVTPPPPPAPRKVGPRP